MGSRGAEQLCCKSSADPMGRPPLPKRPLCVLLLQASESRKRFTYNVTIVNRGNMPVVSSQPTARWPVPYSAAPARSSSACVADFFVADIFCWPPRCGAPAHGGIQTNQVMYRAAFTAPRL